MSFLIINSDDYNDITIHDFNYYFNALVINFNIISYYLFLLKQKVSYIAE